MIEDAARVAPLDLSAAHLAVAAAAQPCPVETLPLRDAVGRYLAQAYVARADLVPYARSAMDGYALRADDTRAAAHAPLVVPVRGAAYAGDARTVLERGCACAIATGGALPHGADAVVPWEEVDERGETIVLRAPLRAGEHVFPSGDDARAGEVVARAGEAVTPGRAALLAAVGVAQVAVHARPRVAILSTGDELVDPAAEPVVGQVRDSNAAILAAQVTRDGGTVVEIARVADDAQATARALRDALAASDLVITTGGASTGRRDHVKRAALALGARFAFTSLAMRPAKPTGFARRGNALLAVLPGNPAAAFVAYTALFGPLVRALAGDPRPALPVVRARLDGTLRAKPGRHFYAFARLHHDGDGFVATLLANQCSSLVRTSADANAFTVVPPGAEHYLPGAFVEVEVFDWASVRFNPRDHA